MAAVRSLAVALLALLAMPALAAARTPQPLVDAVSLGTNFKDRVLSSNPRTARVSLSGQFHPYKTADGMTVAAAISDQYGSKVGASVVQSYVDFLASLDHGPELGELKLYVAPPEEVLSECGGAEGTLACYDSGTKIMYVPGEEVDTGSSGVTTSYVVAHEYGHHIAAARSNEPFNAFRTGPKFWSSYERVCDRSLNNLLAPGNEAELYRSNPGEGWAETYARLKYPNTEWQFDPIMKPDDGAFAAARQDVLNPWQSGVKKTFKGTFTRRGASTKKFRFELTLDGKLQIRLKGPAKANYDLAIASNGRSQGKTTAPGSRDGVSYPAACRTQPVENVVITVKRVKGAGPFTLRAQYAG